MSGLCFKCFDERVCGRKGDVIRVSVQYALSNFSSYSPPPTSHKSRDNEFLFSKYKHVNEKLKPICNNQFGVESFVKYVKIYISVDRIK